MRAICGLFALLIMLGPIGMGIMLNVDSPYLGNNALCSTFSDYEPEDHGTRSVPQQGAMFVNLYFRGNNIMNTTPTSGGVSISSPGSSISFLLQKELAYNYKIENPSPGYPIVAKVTLGGSGDLTVTVRDNQGGNTVGTATLTGFNYGATPTNVDINIPFASGTNYTFSSGHRIEIELDFSQTGRLYYNSDAQQSRLQLYGYTVTDISAETANFFEWSTDTFYPNDINFPDERKKVKFKGAVSEVFGKEDLFQYVDDVKVQIQGPGYNENRTASYNRDTYEYSYTWNYPLGQQWGEYTMTTWVTDEQGNLFSVVGSFNMSRYGVLLTSPSQIPEEGSFQAEARKNLVQNSYTNYEITVRNIGANASGFDFTTTGQSGWDWWLWGDDLDVNNNKSGTINSIAPNDYATVYLSVDAMNNDLGSKAVVLVTATSTGNSLQDHTITTKSTVVLQYDVEMQFSEGTKILEKNIETGDTINVGFTVKNNGGESDDIYIDLSLVPAGWSLTLEGSDLEGSQTQHWVSLASGDESQLTLTIETPYDKGEENVDIDITGRSKGSDDQGDDPVASDTISINVQTTTGLKFTLVDDIEKYVDPDNDVSFQFELENTGTSLANFTVTFTGLPSSAGWESGDASWDTGGFEKEYSNLAPNNPQNFVLLVEPTFDVIAGNYTILVHVENNQAPSSKFADQLIFVRVNEFYNIEILEPLDLEYESEAEPGDNVEYTIRIQNNGNVIERVTITVDKPGDWDLDFGNASDTDWIKDMEPGDEETIPVTLTIPDDEEGDQTVDVTITIIPSDSDIITVETHTKIKQSFLEPLLTLLVPLLLFIVILVMVVVIYKRR